ncbi:hypothetical protein FA13DRAFT_590886 [Coprinellus micaceus]|uniref:Uncharacterized protein n=1 Tax=Coprinellus micaceus TaxID=71717 RepID=A0A4Y7SCF4_COPMI|nr:hypothetical protein FA13DRAFT_590886 [Coprinellus micaceus]
MPLCRAILQCLGVSFRVMRHMPQVTPGIVKIHALLCTLFLVPCGGMRCLPNHEPPSRPLASHFLFRSLPRRGDGRGFTLTLSENVAGNVSPMPLLAPVCLAPRVTHLTFSRRRTVTEICDSNGTVCITPCPAFSSIFFPH